MINLEEIKRIYKLGSSLTLTDVQKLLKAAKMKSFPIGTFLVKEGGVRKEIFFIRKGLVRAFAINEKGDEITTLLRKENQIIASPDIILFNQPAQFYYQALEDTNTFQIDYELLQSIIAANPKLEANRKFIFQNILKETLQRIDSFVLLSPEERYLQFVQANPDLVNRVPNKYIANILGVTPVSLSRIRKRIASKKN